MTNFHDTLHISWHKTYFGGSLTVWGCCSDIFCPLWSIVQGDGRVSDKCSRDKLLGLTRDWWWWWKPCLKCSGDLVIDRNTSLLFQITLSQTRINTNLNLLIEDIVYVQSYQSFTNYLWLFQDPSFWGGPGPWSNDRSPWPRLFLDLMLWLLCRWGVLDSCLER